MENIAQQGDATKCAPANNSGVAGSRGRAEMYNDIFRRKADPVQNGPALLQDEIPIKP